MTDDGEIDFVEQRNYQNTLKSMKIDYKKQTNNVLIIAWYKCINNVEFKMML